MPPVASVVDTDAVLKTIWLALLTGVGLPVAFSLGIGEPTPEEGK